MARYRIWVVVVLGCVSGVVYAASPGETVSPAVALPSPNQSLSIEEDAAEAAIKAVEHTADKPHGEELTGGDGVKSASSAPTSVRPPTFLGRKRTAGDPERPMSETSQAAWYRTGLGALALVLGLMALLYFGLRRWVPSIKVHNGGLVRVLGRTPVGPRQSLVLVGVGQRVLLVGVSPDRIDRLCEISEADEVSALTTQASMAQSRGQFSAWLDREAAAFVESEPDEVSEPSTKGKRPGSKSLSDLLHKLRATKV